MSSFLNAENIESLKDFSQADILTIDGSNRYSLIYNDEQELMIDREYETVTLLGNKYSAYIDSEEFVLLYYGGNFLEYYPVTNQFYFIDYGSYLNISELSRKKGSSFYDYFNDLGRFEKSSLSFFSN